MIFGREKKPTLVKEVLSDLESGSRVNEQMKDIKFRLFSNDYGRRNTPIMYPLSFGTAMIGTDVFSQIGSYINGSITSSNIRSHQP